MNALKRLRKGVSTASAEETRVLAADLAAELPPEVTLALHGDMGVGKTTFVQGLARGLGVAAEVTSPTFTLYTLYRGARLLAHLDAYRLDGPEQAEALLVEDFLEPPYCLAVEWPDRLSSWLPADAWHIDIGIDAPRRHTFKLR
jgi:tRNA threonylcarbamoyladenosine biosynthesis protein TsaE